MILNGCLLSCQKSSYPEPRALLQKSIVAAKETLLNAGLVI